jgi:hypothetical protein
MSWQDDQRWSDRFLPEIKRILGEHLIGKAPDTEDIQRNTDLIVLKLDAVRIACRIRRFEYLGKFHDEFTIRAERPNGNKTELTKIIEGWGDYFFYGFSDQQEQYLSAWMLGNLNEFRLWFNRQISSNQGQMPGSFILNTDNSSRFRAFKIVELPSEFIVAIKKPELSLLRASLIERLLS